MPAIRGPKSKSKTRRYTRDIDQIHADLSCNKHLNKHKDSKAVEDLPDAGRWYCIECAKWFDNESNLLAHRRSKVHKRRWECVLSHTGPVQNLQTKAADCRSCSLVCCLWRKITNFTIYRLKHLKNIPYSQKEADLAAGLALGNKDRRV